MNATASDAAEARRWFQFACLCEFALGVVAAVIGEWFGLPWRAVRWDLGAAAWSIGGTVPLLIVFAWLLKTRWKPITRITDTLDRIARPIFRQWSWLQLAMVSLLAGVGEELLFRAVAQGGLSQLLGPIWGLAIASAVFGALHCVTPAYGVIAALMGAYLGALWLASGNLLVPIIVHGAYDFIALVWLFKLSETAPRDGD